jgi:hypothetical protein
MTTRRSDPAHGVSLVAERVERCGCGAWKHLSQECRVCALLREYPEGGNVFTWTVRAEPPTSSS